MDSKKVSEFATVSDVSFIVLVLENNWELWQTLAGVPEALERAGMSPTDPDAGALPYSRWTSHSRQGGQNAGWHVDGLKRFNQLCVLEAEDRIKEEGKACEQAYLDYRKNCNMTKNSRTMAPPRGPVVVAYIDDVSSLMKN